MTCVVGVRTTKGVLLAADSQMSWENGNRMSRDAKTIELSALLAVAYCGSGRLGQILQHHLDELDDPPLGRDESRWAIKTFVPYLRDVLATAGHLVVNLGDSIEAMGYSAFLFAIRGRLFMVEDDFSVVEHRFGFDALGSGMETAIGAMHTAAGVAHYAPYTEARALKIATEGIKRAGDYTNFVGGDMTTASTQLFTDEERELARKIARPARRRGA
jgi:ATP-dependent protease HslVU (ClpYQ) peptidase subunit